MLTITTRRQRQLEQIQSVALAAWERLGDIWFDYAKPGAIWVLKVMGWLTFYAGLAVAMAALLVIGSLYALQLMVMWWPVQ